MTPQNRPNTDDGGSGNELPPAHVFREYPVSNRAAQTTYAARQAIHRILRRRRPPAGRHRPCSIHDYDAAMEYAGRLAKEAEKYAGSRRPDARLFRKPRTTVGWKGLINDPRLDNTFRINEGIRLARRILLEINGSTCPAPPSSSTPSRRNTPPT